jgi:hypothetical protein
MEKQGLSVPAIKLAELGDVGTEEETLAGPTLGMALRRLIQTLYTFDDAVNWVGKGLTLLAQVESKDWQTAGYSSMTAWLIGTRPGGMAKTQCLNLMTFWKAAAPRIIAAGYQTHDIIGMLDRGAIEELAGLLNGNNVDARLAKVVCKLIESGRLATVDQFRAIKKSPAFINATNVMDMMTEGKVDPVETYVDLADLDDEITARLNPLSQFIINGSLPSESIAGFIRQARELPIDKLTAVLRVPHGKAYGAVDEDARRLEEEIAADLEQMEMGDTDTHTRIILNVQELPGGYYRVVNTPVLTRSMLRELWSTRGVDVQIDGMPMTFGGD